jgi:hypothetical protein
MLRVPWWLAVLIGACIQPSLDVCDGLACPARTACRTFGAGPACYAIAGCDGLASGAACDSGTGQAGTCGDGVCIPVVRCGNGVLEPGEGCDCGDDAVTPRADCDFRNNSDDDPLAPCRADCTRRRCGDEVLDPTEPCDGELVREGLTCRSFGYYAGELACTSLCIVDTDACHGQCGDGVHDPEYEYCDPTSDARIPGNCTDFGFSTGSLQCTSTCLPAFEQCRDAAMFTQLFAGQPGLLEIAPGPSPDEAWVAFGRALYLYHAVSGPALIDAWTGDFALDLASHESYAVLSMASGKVEIYTAAGPNATIAAPHPCLQIVMTTDSELACLGASGVTWWDGVQWGNTLAAAPATDAIALANGDLVYTDYGRAASSQVWRASRSAVTPMGGFTHSVLRFQHIEAGLPPTTGGVYGGLVYGGVLYGGISYGMVHLDDAVASWSVVPNTEAADVAVVGGRTFWSTRSWTSALTPWIRGHALEGLSGRCARFLTVGAGGLCLTERDYSPQLIRFAGATSSSPAGVSGTVSDLLVGDSEERLYYVRNTSGAGGTVPATSWSPPDGEIFNRFAGFRAGRIALLNSGRTKVAQWNGASWDVSSMGSMTAAAPSDGDPIVSVWSGTSCVISQGTTPLLPSPIPCPTALWVSPSGRVWSAGPAEIRDVTANVATPLNAPAGAIASMAGLDDNNLWVAVPGQIWFWNGQTWKVQLAAPGLEFDWLSATPAGVMASAPGFERTTWHLSRPVGGTPVWNKVRLPGDFTQMVRPFRTSWGVVFMTTSFQVRFSVWQDDWL